MRIFQICAGADNGGAEAAFIDTCIAMHQSGMDITAVCRPHPSMIHKLREHGVSVHTMAFGGIFDINTKLRLTRLIKEHKPDIVQTWMNRAALHCPRPGKTLPPFKLVARLGGYYKLKYYKGVSHFITNTPDIKSYLMKNGVPAQQVTHINNLITLDNTPIPVKRSALTTPENAFVFLTLARLHPVKGIDDFIGALAQLPENAYGWIAGDGPEREKLEGLAKQTDVAARIRFLGWRSDKEALLNAANALVVPSRFEPFGNSFAQAWGAGCPLITTNTQGPMQYVQDGTDALVTPMNDKNALAKAMQNLMENTFLCESLANQGLMRFEQEFTPQACLSNYSRLYKEISEKA